MSAAAELQKSIYQALVADAAVGTFIGARIYDNVPVEAVFPYVSFGPSHEIDDDEGCIDGEEHVIQIDVWDRSQGRKVNAKRINSAIKSTLHDADLSMADPYALAFIRVRDTRCFLDADGVTAHGVIIVEARVEL